MLNYTNAQFNRRMLAVPDGKCVTCGGTPEWDAESRGYTSTCLPCFGLFHEGKKIGHSHMFGDNHGYVRADGQRYAWATTVDLRPAFVNGEHVGWFCAGGHGSEPCEWNLTNAEAVGYFEAWAANYRKTIYVR
ncbi:MAG: hypothetical protein JO057_10075 [Chloroflexi bacterium]|nr:hypothetical protein [Chloroflexota bacterium]